MDWAKRELSQLLTRPPSALTSVFDSIHGFIGRGGVFEDMSGTPTQIGQLTTSVFGLSRRSAHVKRFNEPSRNSSLSSRKQSTPSFSIPSRSSPSSNLSTDNSLTSHAP